MGWDMGVVVSGEFKTEERGSAKTWGWESKKEKGVGSGV